LWRETATSWHTPPLLFVLAFQNGWKDRKTYDHIRSPINLLHPVKISWTLVQQNSCDILVRLQVVCGCTCKNTRLCCFHHSLWTDLYQTFSKHRADSGLYYCISLLKGRCYGNRFV